MAHGHGDPDVKRWKPSGFAVEVWMLIILLVTAKTDAYRTRSSISGTTNLFSVDEGASTSASAARDVSTQTTVPQVPNAASWMSWFWTVFTQTRPPPLNLGTILEELQFLDRTCQGFWLCLYHVFWRWTLFAGFALKQLALLLLNPFDWFFNEQGEFKKYFKLIEAVNGKRSACLFGQLQLSKHRFLLVPNMCLMHCRVLNASPPLRIHGSEVLNS